MPEQITEWSWGALSTWLPMGYLLPTTFRLLMHAPEDEAHNYLLASALIVLRYLNRKTQQSTADCLGMTQVQVSRRERVILEEMRRKLTG